MEVTLKGSSPAAITAGIMVLTRARQLGDRITVRVLGDPEDMVSIPGPAVCYAPVLASCGVGRKHGSGATVVVSGPPGQPVLCTVQPHGEGGWFEVDRSGAGSHPATQAFVRLARDPRMQARHLGKELRRGMDALGMSTDSAVLDVLFGATNVPPLTRLAVALRAGRAMSGGSAEPITRYLLGQVDGDPLDPDLPSEHVGRLMEEGGLQWILDGLSTSVRDRAEDWLEGARSLAAEDGGRDYALVHALAELASHLVLLPQPSILPPLGAAEDSVAVGLKNALRAEGEGNASFELDRMFRFLGGSFVASASHFYPVSDTPPPDGHVARWEWFCSEVRRGRKQADQLWPEIINPSH